MLRNDTTTRQALTRDYTPRSGAARGGLALVFDLPTRFAGALSPAGDAAPIHFALRRGDGVDGAWMTFEAEGTGPVPVHLLEASGASVVALVGPYRDPASGVSLHTLLEGRVDDTGLAGTFRTLRADRADTVLGVFSASASEAVAA